MKIIKKDPFSPIQIQNYLYLMGAFMKLVYQILSLIFILTSVGCANGLFLTREKGYIDPIYINGGETKEKLTASKLQDKLTRFSGIGGGNYRAEVYPYTNYLIELETREQGQHEMKSEEHIKSEIAKKKALLTNSETCFMVSVKSMNGLESAKMSNFLVKVQTDKNKIIDYKFTEHAQNQLPNFYVDSAGGIVTTTHYNNGIACGEKIALERGFEVFVIPKFVHDSQKGQKISLKWSNTREPANIKKP
ncbi:MAG: hypothetical protein H6625_14160 [Bdellovibrionaceae bacterium]|nr:hypothetical protein [Pseudobdellovibrionaceae bacterium]